MKDINQYIKQCESELNAIGIYPKVENYYIAKASSMNVWGYCQKHNFCGSVYAIIKISSVLLDDKMPNEALKIVLIHEMLHSIEGCMSHDGKWLELANKVNTVYGYNIKNGDSWKDLNVGFNLIVEMARKYNIKLK